MVPSAVNKSKHSDMVKLSPFLFHKATNFTMLVSEALGGE